MDLLIAVVIALGIVIIVFAGIIVFSTRGVGSLVSEQSLNLIQQQLDALRTQVSKDFSSLNEQVNTRLRENMDLTERTNQSMGERLDNASRVVGEVQLRLGEVKEGNQRIFEIGKDIAELQQLLRVPKLRGGLGELLLGDLLSQILPAHNYEMQHKFVSGESVDAVIKFGMGMVPVDAKFPLENFRRLIQTPAEDTEKVGLKRAFIRDIKRHIDDIASKYIVPDEGTFDFALMYIPAENVYYETIIKDEDVAEESSIFSYALVKKVIPVSPNSLYAYLQAIVLGLRGFAIERNARVVVDNLLRLETDLGKFNEDFILLGKHLRHAQSTFDEGERKLQRLSDKLSNVSKIEDSESKFLKE
ncbi:MAG: DNA recombination protein RmuC [Elusimicrobiota bacterium]